MNPLIAQTTTDSPQEAEKIARLVLNARLAACVQVVPSVRSFYWWKEEVQDSSEWLLSMKTSDTKYKKLERLVKENHSYETPEIIAIAINEVSNEYGDWMRKELGE